MADLLLRTLLRLPAFCLWLAGIWLHLIVLVTDYPWPLWFRIWAVLGLLAAVEYGFDEFVVKAGKREKNDG
jgi:hypothetical protein